MMFFKYVCYYNQYTIISTILNIKRCTIQCVLVQVDSSHIITFVMPIQIVYG